VLPDTHILGLEGLKCVAGPGLNINRPGMGQDSNLPGLGLIYIYLHIIY